MKKDTLFDYLHGIFMIYGFTVLCMCTFSMMFGEAAQGYSTLFALGNKGLGLETLLQFFLLSVIISTLKFVLFTEGIVKNLAMVARVVIMFGAVIVTIVLFVILFGWFPVNMWKPWVMFFVCFLVCAVLSTILSYVKENYENKKMEEALKKLKEGV